MREHFIISTNIDLVRVAADEVVFISSDGNYASLFFTNGETRVLTLPLGQIESMMTKQLAGQGQRFIRIGKSLIVNSDYITYINPGKQQLVLSDGRSANHSLTASREALKQLKEYMEKEVT